LRRLRLRPQDRHDLLAAGDAPFELALEVASPPRLELPLPLRPGHGRSVDLLADRLEQDALAPPAVELGVEDLLPRAEVEAAVGDREHDLVGHELALQVRVRVVLAVV